MGGLDWGWYFGYDPSNKAFSWSMMAKNLNSEEKIEIDKSDFTSNNYNVPMFIEYIPIEPKISNNNILVYSKTNQMVIK